MTGSRTPLKKCVVWRSRICVGPQYHYGLSILDVRSEGVLSGRSRFDVAHHTNLFKISDAPKTVDRSQKRALCRGLLPKMDVEREFGRLVQIQAQAQQVKRALSNSAEGFSKFHFKWWSVMAKKGGVPLAVIEGLLQRSSRTRFLWNGVQ